MSAFAKFKEQERSLEDSSPETRNSS